MNLPRAFLAVIATAALLAVNAPLAGQSAIAPVEPPLGKSADNRIYAQQLVNDLLAANHDLLAVGLHAIPPGSTEYVIVAHLRDLIGKKDSEVDVEMIKNEQTVIGVETTGYTTTPRMVVHETLRDRSGRAIGLIVLSFRLEPNTTKLGAHGRSDALLQELARKIPDSAALFKPTS